MVKRNLTNLASLAGIQGANAVLPIIIFPYLLSLFGAEKYSDLVVSEAIVLVVLAFVIFSYEVNGVTAVVNAEKNDNFNAVSKIFSEVFFSRITIWCVGIICVGISGFFLEQHFFLLLLSWMLLPLSYIFQSSYMFQALETNLPAAVFVVVSRVFCAIVIMLMIGPEDAAYAVPLIVGGAYLMGGLFCFFYVVFVMRIKLLRVCFVDIKNSLYDGREIFLGNIAVVLSRDSNLLILNFITTDAVAISTYSVVEKLIKGFQASMRPLNQFFFTKAIYALRGILMPGMNSFLLILKLTYIQLFILFGLLCALIIFWSGFSDQFEFLKKYPNKDLVISLFLIMAVAVFLGVANFMLGTAGLNNLNARKYYAKALMITGVSTVALCFLLINMFGVYGASASFVFGELLLFVFLVRKYLYSQNG